MGQGHHDVSQCSAAFDHGALSYVARADEEYLLDFVELTLAPEIAGGRCEVRDQLTDRVACREPVALVVDDQLRVEPVTGGEPLVLPHGPLTWRNDRHAGVDLLVDALHEALHQRADGADFLQRRYSVADAQLHGAEVRVWPYVPPDLADRRDRLRRHERVHELLEVGPVDDDGRKARGRQSLEDLYPARRQPGVVTFPIRARRRERQQMREVELQRVRDHDRLLRRPDADVIMDPEDLEALGRPLHLLDELPVAGVGTDRLLVRMRERVASGRDQLEPACLCRGAELVDRLAQVLLGLGRVRAYPGDHLDRALEQLVIGLGVQAVGVAPTQLFEDLAGRAHQRSRLAVHERELHLDAQTRPLGGAELDLHPTRG